MKVVQFELPDDLVAEMNDAELQFLAQKAFFAKLYDLGKISTGKAAQLLGVTRREFLEILGTYGISEFDDAMNLAEESRRG